MSISPLSSPQNSFQAYNSWQPVPNSLHQQPLNAIMRMIWAYMKPRQHKQDQPSCIRPRCAKTGSKAHIADMAKSASLPMDMMNSHKPGQLSEWIAKLELRTAEPSIRRRCATTAAAACSDMSTDTSDRSTGTTMWLNCTLTSLYSNIVKTRPVSSSLTTMMSRSCQHLLTFMLLMMVRSKNQLTLTALKVSRTTPFHSSRWRRRSLPSATPIPSH